MKILNSDCKGNENPAVQNYPVIIHALLSEC